MINQVTALRQRIRAQLNTERDPERRLTLQARSTRIGNIGRRYARNISSTAQYTRDSEQDRQAYRRSGGQTSVYNGIAYNRQYSRNTYMGLNQG